MLQVALGGYYLIENAYNYLDDRPVYYEPGYTIMYPLEIEVPLSDRIYILIRKRRSTNNTFTTITQSNINITVKDTTNDESISSYIYTNTLNTHWTSTSPSFTPLVAYIDNAISLNSTGVRVRTMDCCITDTTDHSFISFRLLVSDANKYFNYIPVVTSKLFNRPSASALSRDIKLQMKNESDIYLVISPYAYLQEVTRNDNYDFSYPLDSIYYKRQNTYNNEDFDFSIGSVDDAFINDNVVIMNIPGYEKAAVVHIDHYLYTKIREKGSGSYFYMNIHGRTTEISDSLKITITA
jgi:hypothetical protein